MQRLLLSVSLACLLVACGGTTAPQPVTSGDTTTAPADVAADSQAAGSQADDSQADAPPGTSADCADGGGRPAQPGDTGELENCPFEAAGCCYDTAEIPCRLAGCAVADCDIMESYPAQVACR